MIRAGQIYKSQDISCPLVVIRVDESKSPFAWVYFIFNNGYVERLWKKSVEAFELIAEYPTWQEAVNSKEFAEGI